MWTVFVLNCLSMFRVLWEKNRQWLWFCCFFVCPFTIITTYTNVTIVMITDVCRFLTKICFYMWKYINIWHNRSRNSIEILSFWFFIVTLNTYVKKKYISILFCLYCNEKNTCIDSPPLKTRFYCHHIGIYFFYIEIFASGSLL